ncbi:tetratricopeptide repeat protein [Streptomyces lancefieldiae]|uniref:Tetratricopeptide repeat protein n=1 Tax=Streptomyces lancefieldiae TaxID=3075520 RepID=A0ABU3B1Y7_9ACTN|nr:tetratricopeptide repeat protein [Streptomyces sp. DSM 40712]MDT0616140.1 tetratricopeptide repeat protein [Streptomyces sp. DSM 40712]
MGAQRKELHARLRGLRERAEAARREANRPHSQQALERAVQLSGLPKAERFVGKRASDWAPKTFERFKMPQSDNDDVVLALVTVWSQWAGEKGDERWWRNQLTRAREEQPLTVGADLVPTTHGSQVTNLSPDVPSLLPDPPTVFTGREQEVHRLLVALAPKSASIRQVDSPTVSPSENPAGGGVVVSAVAGMAGVGKTALALTVAQRAWAQGWFTNALYVDLRGYDLAPVTADQALEVLLRQLGAEPERIPPTVDERAGMYRSLLQSFIVQGRAVLVVADNVSRADQVLPLIPASGPHRLLTTSRHTLPTLISVGVASVELGTLSPDGAVALVCEVLNRTDATDRRVVAEPQAVVELTRLCGYLPLALHITAALLAMDPYQQIADLTTQLAGASSRLDHLNDGERAVRTSLDLSHRHLSPEQADLLALLSLNPGPDFGLEAASVLAGTPADRTRSTLRELTRAHLLDHTDGRWSMHDLVRDYATEKTQAAPSSGECARSGTDEWEQNRNEQDARHSRQHPWLSAFRKSGGPADTRVPAAHPQVLAPPYYQALGRLLNHYRVTAHYAAGRPSLRSRRVFSRADGLSWLDSERANLVAAVKRARNAGFLETAINLALTLDDYLDQQRRFDDWVTVTVIARDAAHETGDKDAEARAWGNLGNAFRQSRRADDAVVACERARDLFQQLNERHYEAQASTALGHALQEAGRVDEAIATYENARVLYQQMGHKRGEADVGDGLGKAFTQTGRIEDAISTLEHARDVYQQLRDPQGLAIAWDSLGRALQKAGRSEEAITAHQTARDLNQQLNDRHGEASSWRLLGTALQHTGRFEEAITAHQTARDLFQHTNDLLIAAATEGSLANALQAAQRFNEAITALERARGLFRQLNERHGEAMSWEHQGLLLQKAGRIDEAITALERACDLYRQLPNRQAEETSLNRLADALQKAGRLDEAALARSPRHPHSP